MENATKALVMAGGVLIAIMTIATLIYAASSWGLFPSSKEQSEAVKQLAEFNQQYESYNKKALYGMDVVSVINKARDNNENITDKDTEFINISVELVSQVQTETTTYRDYMSGTLAGTTRKMDTEYETRLDAGVYELDGKNDKTFNDFLDNFMSNTGRIIVSEKTYASDENGKYLAYTVTIVPNSEFKIKPFECTKVEYNSAGRICYMKFKEIEPSKINNNG